MVYRQVGTTTVYVPVSIYDTNGNYLTIAYSTASNVGNQAISTITDTLGRVITFNYNSSGELTSITAPAFGGGPYTAANFQWGTADLTYDFSLTVNDSPASGTNINVLTGCTYPNGTGYTFSYGAWGIVDEIKQNSSTGVLQSSVSYNYPSGSTKLAGAPAFTQQTIFDGVNTGTWTYANTISNGLVTSMAITDPTSTITTTNLSTSGLPATVTVGTSSKLLEQINYTWAGQLPSTITTILKDTGQSSQQSFNYGSYGNVSQVTAYDYGFALLGYATNTYLNTSAYINQHIYNRLTETQVFNRAATLVSQTVYAYDGSALTSETGATNHSDAGYGTGFTTRGNLTSTTNYPTTSTPISHAYTYDTLGNLLTAQVSCCNQETWTFAHDNQYAYPEVLTRGSTPSFTSDWSYDFSTGLVKTQTDENGQVTSFAYDSMKRITSVTRPDNAVISNSYTDSLAEPTVQTTIPVDSGLAEYQTTTVTGPGRVVSQELSNSSSSGSITSIVNTAYDDLGRVSEVSNPYASGGTPTYTTYSYDSLSRPVTVTPPGSLGSYQYTYTGNATTVTDPAAKARETFTDALGRITQVYEPGYNDGTDSKGTVTISGTQQIILEPNPNPPPAKLPFLDSGSVSVTVGSFTASYDYGVDQEGDTATTIADGLASAFDGPNSPVTASVTGSTVSLTSRVAGLQADYPLSVSVTYDSSDFSRPSFAAAPSGATMTGGADGLPNGTTPSLSTPLVTVSNYDPLGDLTSVLQGQQTRTFVYDGMGRLTAATTPEAGTVQYTYTTFSQVNTREDARNITSTYAYDGINRLTGITYSDGVTKSVSFGYDQGTNGIDRLTKMTDGVGSESYTYDILGRETGMTKTISGIAYPLAYSYNTANELKQITYPSGRTVAQTVDALGRLIQVTSSSTNYISGVNYNAAAQPTSYQYGNGVQAAFSYNAQMQLQSLSYSNTSGTIVGLTYGYGTGDNGQIQSVTDSADAGRTANYTYDAWARLKTAQTTGDTAYPAWGLSFTYDRYGNRTAQSVTTGSAPANSLSFSTTGGALTNHADTFSYDASGNMLSDGTNTLTYDAENRTLTSAGTLGSATYTYDGNGLRVEKSGSNGSTIYIFSGAKVIGEYAPGAQPSSPATEYIYAGANLVASITSGTPTYYHPDQLSARALTSSTGSVVGQQGHYPFGESWYSSGTVTKWKFTSYERDPESANDYAMARYDINRLGRFNSPDPVPGSIADPQSWNRYVYVRNGPANLLDPLGLHWETACVVAGGVTSCENVWYDDPIYYVNETLGDVGGGGGGGGNGDPGPGSPQNQVSCDTVLPDGSTIGGHVNSVVNSLNNAANADLANPVLEAQSGMNPLLVAYQTYTGTNFKLMYQGSANAAFLGNAGNFAYGAVAANMGIPLSTAELVAGGYAHLTHPSNQQVGPFGMDQSAKDNVPAGYNAQCKDQ